MSYEIVAYRAGNPQLRIEHDGYEVFGMTLSPVDAASHEWLGQILDRAFQDGIRAAVRRERMKDQAAMRNLLGIGS